jgi:hypothetical protein
MTHSTLSRFLWLFSLMLGLLLAPKFVQAQATSAVTVRLSPAVAEVPLGQTVDVAVEVVAVQDLYGFDITAKFDPTAIEVVDADPNQTGIQVALGTFPDSGFAILNTANNLTGTLRFAMTQLNPSEPKSGTGALIVIHLRGKQVSDSTPFTLTNVELAKRDGTGLATNLVSGEISVVSSAGSPPVSTPIPTQGAGTPMPTATQPAVPTATAVVEAAVQPTFTPMAADSSARATPTPRPTDRSVSSVASTPIESVTPPSTIGQAVDIKSTTVTLEMTTARPVSAATVSTNTPVAVVAVNASSATPSAIQSAIQVTEPAAPAVSSSESVSWLLAVSGVLGMAGLITVWLVTRRRLH